MAAAPFQVAARGRSRAGPVVLRLVLLAGAAAVVSARPGHLPASIGLLGSCALAASWMLKSVRARPENEQMPWLLMSGGVAAAGVGAASAHLQLSPVGLTGAFLHTGSVLSVIGYALIIGAGVWMTRLRDPRPGTTLEIGIVALAGLLIAWTFVLEPHLLEIRTENWSGDGLRATFIVLDVALVALATRSLAVPGRPGADQLLAVGAVFFIVPDHITSSWLPLLGERDHDAASLSGLLPIAFGLLAIAIVQPASTARGSHDAENTSLLRYVVVMGSTLIAVPALLGSSLLLDSDPDRVVVALAGTVVLLSLVFARLAVLVRREAAGRAAQDENIRLQRADAIKDSFVATVSHELRTPLTSIRGYMELVLDEEVGSLTDDQRRFLGVVDRNSERLLHLVNDLLFVARMDAGELRLDHAETDLSQLLTDAAQSARATTGERGITVDVDARRPTAIVADRERLAQLLDNLVGNAVKFSGDGGHIRLDVADDGEFVLLDVSDDGPGISAEEQKHLFERFFRTEASIESATQGTGLGLAICQGIAEAHGGSLSVISEPGHGATFRARIPRAPLPVVEAT